MNFGDIIDFDELLGNYENKVDIESKVVHLLDKIHSSTTFMKYQSEQNVDMNDSRILPILRNHPFVVKKVQEGKDLADIFYEFHMKAIKISDEECDKYDISRDDADKIVTVISTFAKDMYSKKINGTLLDVQDDFPGDAMVYNRNK